MRSSTHRPLVVMLDLAVAAAVVALTLYVAEDIIKSKPRPTRTDQPRRATLVEVQAVRAGSQQVMVEASGVVRAARQVTLRPQVTGSVVERNDALEVGSFLRAGDMLLRVDDRDYVIALRRARAELIQAQAALKLERGSGRLAKREYQILGSDPKADRELVLRKPQLAAAKAKAAAAAAAVARASLELERTLIAAPFDAVVRARDSDLGSQVSPATDLATLVGTDSWWVDVRLPAEQLRWLEVGDEGEGATTGTLTHDAWERGTSRAGRVAHIAPDVDEGGRMARVLLAVEDPLARSGSANGPRLRIGDYLRVTLKGRELSDVVALDRQLLQDGNTVWVMTPEDTLAIREVQVAYSGRSKVLLSAGLDSGDRVVTSPLPAPVEGMALRLKGRDEGGDARAVQVTP